jgi:MFS family permease
MRELILRPEIRLTLTLMLLHMLLLGIAQVTVPLYSIAKGVSNIGLGVVVGAFGLSGALFAIPGSVLSDRFGRRPSFVVAFMLWMLAAFVFHQFSSIFFLSIGQVLAGAADLSIFVGGIAQLIELGPRSKQSEIMSMSSGTMGLGLIAGPAIGGILIDSAGYQSAFLAVMLLGMVGTLLSIRIHETRNPEVDSGDGFGGLISSYSRGVRLVGQNAPVRLALLISAIGTMGWMSVGPSFYLTHLRSIGCGANCVGVLAALRAAGGVLGRFSFASIAGVIGPTSASLLGMGTGGLALLVSPALGSIPLLAITGGIGEAADRLRIPGMHTLLALGTDRRTRSLSIAMSTMAWAIMSMITPPALGLLADSWGLFAAFLVPGAILLISAGILRIRSDSVAQLPI